MAISFPCPSCASRIKAPDNAAGRPCKCPQCGLVKLNALAAKAKQQKGIVLAG